jgi:catechol O-methyltransferase
MSNPFDCFGSDDDNDDNGDSDFSPLGLDASSGPGPVVKEQKAAERNSARDQSCGVLAFHPNTEQSLLMHVQNSVPTCKDDLEDKLLPCENVLKEIDWYCAQRHWMMCVGPEKGAIIRESLQNAIENRRKKDSFIAVELGTYCGYGSIFLSSMLKQNSFQHDENALDFHLFTVEINPEFAKVATKMIELAEVQDIVTVVENDLMLDGSTTNVGDLIKASYVERYGNTGNLELDGIDFLMIDHDKDSYLSDLKRLEASGLIRKGTVVAADNVVFAGIAEYIDYMHELEKDSIVKTFTREATVEYCLPDVQLGGGKNEDLFKDGVGKSHIYSYSMLTKVLQSLMFWNRTKLTTTPKIIEITEYLQDPR